MSVTTDLIFEDSSVNAHKFWSATVDGPKLTVHFGRIGTTGQVRTTHFAREFDAVTAMMKKQSEKLAKGYVLADRKGTRPQWSSADIAGAVSELGEIAKSLVAPKRISVPEIRPMLAEEVKGDIASEILRAAADDNIVVQGKVDGHRLIIHVGDELQVLGRAGQISQHAPRFATKAYADISDLKGCVIDGELVGDAFWLFDVPFHDELGINLDSPYRDRLSALEEMFARWSPGPNYRLLPTARAEVDKTQLAVDWLGAGCEGIILKHLDASYKPGRRVSTVRKVKFTRDIDVQIISIGADGHENYVLGVYKDGVIVDGHGRPDPKNGIGRCSSIGKPACKVGDVATVRFLYVGADGRLYQPRFMAGPRTDKAAHECLYDQVEGMEVNKEVLA